MRRACRVDNNQKLIVDSLRKLGFSVLIVSQLKNCFDILVGYKDLNFAFELKSSRSAKLTKGEQLFHSTWKGQVSIVYSLKDITDYIDSYLESL